ncbi:hypothetical protein [Arthrobacter polaris]|nr:hypothetical protein [Arthrobacter polaris]UIK89468.1 hypothetical protein J0916_03195 [Arthrobacter polaris]
MSIKAADLAEMFSLDARIFTGAEIPQRGGWAVRQLNKFYLPNAHP